MYFSAFLLGLTGSLHCVGMCGPLTLLLPDKTSNLRFLIGRLIYNFGRICTYSILGATTGLFGEKITFFISQKNLSIFLGVMMILLALLPSKLKNRITNPSEIYYQTSILKSFFAKLFKKKSLWAQFSFGIINGLLPCGLIYAALAGAFLMTNISDAAIFMAMFGLGTVPLMLPVSMGFGQIKKHLGKHFKLILTTTYILVGIWLIYRGINYHKTTLYTAPNTSASPECHTP